MSGKHSLRSLLWIQDLQILKMVSIDRLLLEDQNCKDRERGVCLECWWNSKEAGVAGAEVGDRSQREFEAFVRTSTLTLSEMGIRGFWAEEKPLRRLLQEFRQEMMAVCTVMKVERSGWNLSRLWMWNQ